MGAPDDLDDTVHFGYRRFARERARRGLGHDVRQGSGDIVQGKDIVERFGQLFGPPSQRRVNSLLYQPRPYLISRGRELKEASRSSKMMLVPCTYYSVPMHDQ